MRSTRPARFVTLAVAAIVVALAAGLAITVGVISSASASSAKSRAAEVKAKAAAATCSVNEGVRLCQIEQGVLAYQGLGFPTAYSSNGSKENVSAARLDASQLLTRFVLPAGTTVMRHRPAGDHGCLARQAPEFDAGVANRWWVTSVAPQTLIHDLDFRSPRGGVPTEYGKSGGPQAGTWCFNVTLQWPAIVNKLGYRQVVVTATRLSDGRTGVLLSSESGAVILRSTSERIPAGVTRVSVKTTQPVSMRAALKNPNYAHFKTETTTVSAAATVEQIVNLADALPLSGGVSSCTLEFASERKTVTIGFYGAGGQRLALLNYADYGAWGASTPNGCQPVMLKIGGRWRSPLLDVYFVTKLRKLVPARLF